MASIQIIVYVFLSIGWQVTSASREEREVQKTSGSGVNSINGILRDFQRFLPNVKDIIDNREFREKCLEGLGCFYNGPPFFHPLLRTFSFLPSDLKDMNTKFYLYTSKHERVLLEPNKESFFKAPYKKDQDLLIFIPGYLTEFSPDILAAMEEVFGTVVVVSPRNVILVDWTASNKEPYAKAVANGRVVGAQVAQLIKYLQNVAGLDPRKVHLIGHSLGAHVAGWASERVPNIGRITGLDPAGPYFRHSEPKVRLDTTDAIFVDVIHTCVSSVIIEGWGIDEPIGHIDFYVNGGRSQPGCEGTVFDMVIGGTLLTSLLEDTRSSPKSKSLMCSHLRSLDIFYESVGNSKCKFIGTECPDYQMYRNGWCRNNKKAEMGFYAKKDPDVTPRSKFYLTTSVQPPYCIPN